MSSQPVEPLIDVDEAARITGMSIDWLYEQAAANRLPSYKLGGRRKFRASELEGFIQEHASGKIATVTPLSRERRR